jgi:hypothetical protein
MECATKAESEDSQFESKSSVLSHVSSQRFMEDTDLAALCLCPKRSW